MIEVPGTDEFEQVFLALNDFDPLRQAVLLLGGDKTGNKRFYVTLIPRAEAIWESYLSDQGFQR